MKNRKIMFGLLAILLAWGMTVVGCVKDELDGTTWKEDGTYAIFFQFKNRNYIVFRNVGFGPVIENNENIGFSSQGTYTIYGNAVTIKGDDGEKLKGTLSGGVLTIQNYILKKQ